MGAHRYYLNTWTIRKRNFQRLPSSRRDAPLGQGARSGKANPDIWPTFVEDILEENIISVWYKYLIMIHVLGLRSIMTSRANVYPVLRLKKCNVVDVSDGHTAHKWFGDISSAVKSYNKNFNFGPNTFQNSKTNIRPNRKDYSFFICRLFYNPQSTIDSKQLQKTAEKSKSKLLKV